MGYSTRYKLTWEKQKGFDPIPNCEHRQIGRLCAECGTAIGVRNLDTSIGEYIKAHEDMMYAIDEKGDMQESCKWNEHENDMIEMSLAFPDVLFKLHGEGEESGEIWGAYFLNGKHQVKKARVMIDDVDPKDWK